MQTHSYEVIIVGGGPAGASAATILGQRGKSVLLMDKDTFPREKTCGDGMTFKCIPALGKLGIANAFTATATHTTGYRMIFSDGTELTVRKELEDGQALVYTMPRREFDNLLLKNARTFPTVRVAENTAAIRALVDGKRIIGVEATANGESPRSLYAPLVIDASGVDSRLAAQLNGSVRWTRDYALTVRGYYDGISGLDGVVEFVFDKRIAPGYFWIFPVAADAANVGCGTLRPVMTQRDLNLRGLFLDFVSSHPAATKLRSARLRAPLKGGRIPVGVFAGNSRVRDGLIFCGDAAGFCDPLTAEGISFALESGVRAGEIAAAALAAGDFNRSFLSRYDASCRQAFGERFAHAQIGRQPVEKRYFIDYALATLSSHPALDSASHDVGAQYELMFRLKGILKAL